MLIVGFAGGTGSGRTTVVSKVMDVFPENQVIVIPQDSYCKDNREIPPEERPGRVIRRDFIIPGGGEKQVGIEVPASIIIKVLSN